MKKALANLREQTITGLREISEHPIRYSARAIGEFVRDYWDLGVTAFGGYLFSKTGADLDLFGNCDMLAGIGLFGFGVLAGYGSGDAIEGGDRGGRNCFAGISGMLIGSGDHLDIGLGAVTSAGALYLNRHVTKRRRWKKAEGRA